MTTHDESFATDEDVLLQVPRDFVPLCPKHQNLAAAKDGFITSTDPWTLYSQSVDFISRGIKPGHVVQIVGPSAAVGPAGDILGISAVAEHALTLRRTGLPAGLGHPPGSPGGLSGLDFFIPTLGPQIVKASLEIARRCGIDHRVPGRRFTDLKNESDIRIATVLSVIHRRYLDHGRGDQGGDDPLMGKALIFASMLDSHLGRMVVHWSDQRAGCPIRFTTKLFR